MPHSADRKIKELDEKFYAVTCVEKCRGKCCDPWWGVIFFSIRRPGGISGAASLEAVFLDALREREDRIRAAYVTREDKPRHLFGAPSRYLLKPQGVEVEKTGALRVDLLVMFAFSCLFFSDKRDCAVHPSVLGKDIRPLHCAELGEAGAKEGDKGFCRIISAAAGGVSEAEVAFAIETEARVSKERYEEGSSTAKEAAERAAALVKEVIGRKYPALSQARKEKTPERNDPCPCGSGKKFKKCHGG